MLIKFSKKIFAKEWRKLLLPFLSVILTALVVSVSYFLISSAKDFLELKNKEFLGGDLVFESSQIFSIESLIDDTRIKEQSTTIDLNGLLSNGLNNQAKNTSANIEFVDESFPLYGVYVLQNSTYQYLAPNEVYLDEILAKNLDVIPGDTVYFNKAPFLLKDIILEDPSKLFAGFNFFGKAIFSKEAINFANIDLSLFRKEFKIKAKIYENLDTKEIANIREKANLLGIQSRFDTGGGGFSLGLEIVEKFLVVAILIISVLSLVNIYASVNYLGRRLRRDFAVLLALGMENKNIYRILFLINILVITSGTILGIVFGYLFTNLIEKYIIKNFNILLFNNATTMEFFFLAVAIILTGVCATWPIINRLKGISPRELLAKDSINKNKKSYRNNIFFHFIGVLPIAIFAIYFLESFWGGVAVVSLIIFIYLVVMFVYKKIIGIFYTNRHKFSFSTRMVISQKKFDGFFGLVSFASLFVALLAIFSLSIVRTSIERFLLGDLQNTLPDTYIIDVQNSQRDQLLNAFPDIKLFPNVRARILQIDEVLIQEELSKEESEINRELGREFNLTYRNNLLPNEKIAQGVFNMSEPGFVSVEKEFADRANIKMNSKIVFLIQGFKVPVVVASIRESDTRSGLPFFYFILSPSDIERFPATYFGYANLDSVQQSNLSVFLTQNIPNASIINTSSITELAKKVIQFLIVIILMITLPPLLLSAFLIITLLATVAKERKRDGARMMALGRTKNFIRNYYIIESIITALFASVLAYIVSLLISNLLILNYLGIDNIVYAEPVSLYILCFTVCLLFIVSIVMWRGGGRSLREYLNYEENN